MSAIAEKLELLKRLLVDKEGFNPEAHEVDGIMHIGFGHCLDQEQTDEELEAMDLEDELDDWTGLRLTEGQCDNLFAIDVQDALEDARSIFPQDVLDALTPSRWAVIMSMVFQMGGGGLRKFKAFIQAVLDGDWDRAADEMLWSNGLRKKKRSAWYKQTPDRCQDAADAMRAGYFDQYEDTVEEVVAEITDELGGFSTEQLIDELLKRFKQLENKET